MTEAAGGAAAGNNTAGAGASAGGNAAGGEFSTITVQDGRDTATGAGASVNMLDTSNADAAAPDFKTQLGDFAKDPAFANFKGVGDVAKALKEAQTLVGKKLGIPSDQSTPEEKGAFYKALGVPDAPEGYGLKKPEGLPPALEKAFSEERMSGFAKLAKEINLTKDQVVKLEQWERGNAEKMVKDIALGADRSEAAFQEQAIKLFGSLEKAKEVWTSANIAMQKYVPQELKSSLAELPNNVLLATAAMFSGRMKETGGEDKNIGGGDDSRFAGKSAADLREEAKGWMDSDAGRNALHKDYEATQEKIRNNYKMAAEITEASRGRK